MAENSVASTAKRKNAMLVESKAEKSDSLVNGNSVIY